ncbi:AIR synthase [Saccharolobus solfataricus]|uniref:AIR synthase n=2 Tax=Saccharolobus solfataricus TaxID=2287 RepID=A0A0E3K201_SACSO|nr:AIR synthase family protein [Saccharolobus solfataricus]AKA75038.1 AIR synthase [Saccharolobus solfataricus]AKA77731.1 AIR synthase [Saccharolobus solfataricus]AKA80423.1 AIR synthase [Saccharolobus solfataricus]AZF69488.1 AIR synthase [Saccharolobus solfataricus]AZF72108.1 AIR synthase [Saccharolobus solfataricus]
MNFGKVPINKFIYNLPIGDCLTCPSIGEDAAVLEAKDKYLIVHSDPITEAKSDSGFLSIAVACNDINMKGAQCRWVNSIILLSDISHLNATISAISEACNLIGCKVVGGHTEVSDKVKQDIIITTAIGVSNKFLSYKNVKEGMKVVLVGSPGIEGTWILAKDYDQLLLEKGISREIIEKAKEFKKDIVVQPKALSILDYVVAMHDATEGGIMQAMLEVAKASGYTVSINLDKIVLRRETKIITKALNIDPLRLISSGSFIAVSNTPEKILERISEAYIIGEIKRGDPVLEIKGVGTFNQDFEEELVKFESNYLGWGKG